LRRVRRTILGFLAACSIAVAVVFATGVADAAFTGAQTTVSGTITSVIQFPPIASAPPVFTAVAQQGQPLTATNGTWTRDPAASTSYTYQWKLCDPSGNNCNDISGGTAATYTPLAADVGGTLQVVVTASSTGGGDARLAETSAASTPVLVPAPVNTWRPVLSGIVEQGQQLTVSTGSWSYAPDGYTYAWQRCDSTGANCVDIAGATALSYTPVAGDVGATLVATVTAHNGGGTTPQPSAQSAIVAIAPPVNTVLPAITGLVQAGQTLSASDGTWSNLPAGYSYQWQDCDITGQSCTPIPGAIANSYVAIAADVGQALNVTVTATNASGSSTATSAATGLTTAAPVNTALPTVSGTAQQGSTLSATTGTWTGAPGPSSATSGRTATARATAARRSLARPLRATRPSRVMLATRWSRS